MPYIKRESRPPIDKLVEPLVTHLRSLPMEEQDGALNYAVTKVLLELYPRRYFHFNRAIGVLTAIKDELYRHRVGPYEDEKIKENGDVEPMQPRS